MRTHAHTHKPVSQKVSTTSKDNNARFYLSCSNVGLALEKLTKGMLSVRVCVWVCVCVCVCVAYLVGVYGDKAVAARLAI